MPEVRQDDAGEKCEDGEGVSISTPYTCQHCGDEFAVVATYATALCRRQHQPRGGVGRGGPNVRPAPNLTDLEVGKAAEHLVVADLILAGHRAYLSDQGLPYDVILDDAGMLYRIQVKASRDPRQVPQRRAFTPGYIFHIKRAGKGGRRRYGPHEFDLFAFVALDIRTIAYLPFSSQRTSSIILRPPGHQPAANASRLQNIDQLPLEAALTTLRRACSVPAPIVVPNSKPSLKVGTELFAATPRIAST
jgi:hypothetical protein